MDGWLAVLPAHRPIRMFSCFVQSYCWFHFPLPRVYCTYTKKWTFHLPLFSTAHWYYSWWGIGELSCPRFHQYHRGASSTENSNSVLLIEWRRRRRRRRVKEGRSNGAEAAEIFPIPWFWSLVHCWFLSLLLFVRLMWISYYFHGSWFMLFRCWCPIFRG